jgi:hypothetical protein
MIKVVTSTWNGSTRDPQEVTFMVDAEEITLTYVQASDPVLKLTDENGILVAAFRHWERAGHVELLSDGIRDTRDAGTADVDQ